LCLKAFLVDFVLFILYYSVYVKFIYLQVNDKTKLKLKQYEYKLGSRYKKQWVTSQPPIAHFNLNLNYEKFICLFTLQK